VDVLPARGAPRVRPGIGGRVDREPEPGPPGARVPHLRGVVRRQPGQRLLQQAVVDHVVLRDPRAGPGPADGLRQFRCQQGEEPLVVDSPGGQRVVQCAVAAGELRLQAQLHQRRHGVIGAQDRVGQLEQGVRPRVQAFIQRLPEPAQPFQRPVARDRVREHRRIRRARGHARQGLPGSRDGLQPGTGPWQGRKHGRFLLQMRDVW